ncbi:UbiA prenyltransferase family protein [Methanocella paludicola SANAE]|uniref:UbiA prenyltransferase family protein n=1 Tax=Methanocella paludicola (strain DSM 17711 / JCM 13418 / NBRC 101707 / SANAE) TaxID=304371 RepID=D1Z1D0_METPS|nr:prenyltransferase [Methanocella paludicola]BAI62502.1 UbiA prenyltransferase family protein [Methanocella paludicola SANAE]
MNIQAWLKEFRVLFLIFVALPVVMGSAVAYAYVPESFSLLYGVLAVVAMMALHAGTVIVNDYFDFKSGTDVLNKERTPYSGGSGLLPEGKLSPMSVLIAGLLSFGLSAVLGIFIVITRSPAVLAVGFIGAVIGFFYTAPPFKLAYRGLGETARLIATPLMVLGAFVVQVPLSPANFNDFLVPLAVVFVSSLPVAFLNTAAMYIFQFPDYEADSAVGKKNLVVRLGRKNAVYVFILLSALAYLAFFAGILSGMLPYFAAIAFVALPLSAFACQGLLKYFDRPRSLVPYMKSASDSYILATIVLTVAFVL